MKKLRDIIYDYNDIFVTLLIIALSAFIILWRVEGIMTYAATDNDKTSIEETDIDFSGIDLEQEEVDDIQPVTDEDGNTPDPAEDENDTETEEPVDDPDPAEEPDPVEEPAIDDNYVSIKEVTITVKKGMTGNKIAGALASAYGYSNDDYKNFVTVFVNKVNKMGYGSKLQIGTFTIPEGSNLETMVKIIAKRK